MDSCEFVNEYSKQVGTRVDWYDERVDYNALEDTDGDWMFETWPQRFVALFAANTTEDDSAFPVLLYKRDGKMVAWWDCENMCGYYVAEGVAETL